MSTNRRTKTQNIPATVPDKLQPNSVEAEEAVLGSLLIDPDAIIKVTTFLKPEDFYIKRHAWIYDVIRTLHDGPEPAPADLITVSDLLEKRGQLKEVGGSAYISTLINRTPTSIHLGYYSNIVKNSAELRLLIDAAGQISRLGYDAGADHKDAFNRAEEILFGITGRDNGRGGPNQIRGALNRYYDRLEYLSKHSGQLVGLPTGLIDLDRLLGGLQRSDMIVMAGRPGMGKCLGFGTKVIMFNGDIKPVQKIKPGDLLMGPDSKPRKVLSISSGLAMMYHIKQNYGQDYRVNGDHILSLKRNRTEKKQVKGSILNISVSDAITKSKGYFFTRYSGYKTGVDFEAKPVCLPPYFLGLWLGDGDTDKATITNEDQEIVDYLHSLSIERQEYVNFMQPNRYLITGGRSQLARESSITAILGRMNLLGNKHIPKKYLFNSKENRLQLLAGLIDSDGHLNAASGSYEITLKLKNLIEQTKLVCDSLGYRTVLKQKIVDGKIYFRLRISGNIDEIPVKIPRKKASSWTSKGDWKLSRITIERDRFDSYYGFELDGDGLFLLEDFTVTHNTSLALSIALHVSRHLQKRVAIFSLEMSDEQLIQRLISAETGIDSQRLRLGDIKNDEWPTFLQATNLLAQTHIFIDDTPAITAMELRSKARRLHAEHGLDLLIVDYMQLMSGDKRSENRQQEISFISRSIKALARELNIPVLALSQLSRQVESRHDKRPILSDLRESGSIEQDADVVIFIYRDDVYNPDSEFLNIAELIVSKHRSGPTGVFSVYFKRALAQFVDLQVNTQSLNEEMAPHF